MCTGCENLFSGLISGFVSLAVFIISPILQIISALFKMILEKVGITKD